MMFLGRYARRKQEKSALKFPEKFPRKSRRKFVVLLTTRPVVLFPKKSALMWLTRFRVRFVLTYPGNCARKNPSKFPRRFVWTYQRKNAGTRRLLSPPTRRRSSASRSWSRHAGPRGRPSSLLYKKLPLYLQALTQMPR